ncbi:MAG TPA: DUF305 domain-containing protein [Acidimicrobiales bacterium]|nr:DUF305 domain-containing protein [Acidimicrobiales bacterium]
MRRHQTANTRPSPGATGRRAAALSTLLLTLLTLALAPPAAADTPARDKRAARFEVAFMREMIDHHEMGVHMAHPCIEKALHADLRRLCRSIARVQAAEIKTMQKWLRDWYKIDHQPSTDHPGHHRDMETLESLSGAKFEIAFLEMMIEHHLPAVEEGMECLEEAEHAQLKRLCQGIVTSQVREINQMQVWLCKWYKRCDFRDPLET